MYQLPLRLLPGSSSCCAVCPSSNLLLKVYPDVESHPLRQLMDAGVPCSIGSDDPLLFGPCLLEEFQLIRERERTASNSEHSVSSYDDAGRDGLR